MPRVVMGFPNHKLVQNAAVFGELLDTVYDNWRETPVKYLWTPSNPGDIQHLQDWLGNGPVLESDKKNWDYMMYEPVCRVVREVVKKLVVFGPSWKESEKRKYMADVTMCFEQALYTRRFRCSTGEVFGTTHSGIMPVGTAFYQRPKHKKNGQGA